MAKCGMCMGRGSYDDPPWGIRVCVLCHGTGHDDPGVELWDRKGNVQHSAVERFGEARAQMKRIEQAHAAKSEFQREVEKMGNRGCQGTVDTCPNECSSPCQSQAAQQQAEPGADEPVFWISTADAEFLKSRMQLSARITAMHKGGGKRVPVFFAAQSGQRAGVAEGDVLTGWVFEHRVDDGVCVIKSPSGSRFVAHPGTPVHELVMALMTEPAAAPTQQQEGGS